MLIHRDAGVRQLLGLSQERALWELALRELAAPGDDPEALRAHAGALMRAASLAMQSLLPLARLAVTEEELLLVAALERVRALCVTRGALSLGLALPEELAFLAGSEAPLVVGHLQLTALQQLLHARHWPQAQLLQEPLDSTGAVPVLRRCAHLDAEISACASWCRDQLQADGTRRLLVVSAWQDPGPHTQGAMLWRAFAGSGSALEEQRLGLLAVEGGEPLHHQALIGDALAALATTQWIESRLLLRLLRSPYFEFGSVAECAALQSRIGDWGLARWRFDALRVALGSVTGRLPAAQRMLQWLETSQSLLQETAQRSAMAWAECFSHCLRAAGFAMGGGLDSQDAQRLARWGQLLDEYAGLDVALPPLGADEALRMLRRLAQQSTYQTATGDAAITFTTQMHDPLCRYDGIWVMGLSESRWPAPPRPDPYVPLHAQRRCDWPQAGVSQQLQAARWLLQRWQARTDNLVLSFARQEGDVRHRPAALLSQLAATWTDDDPCEDAPPAAVVVAGRDASLPPMSADELALPLRGGVTRLRVQQECAFHAQAQWRLGADAPPTLTEGINSRLRGMLLHSLLEGLWGELQDQQHLLALTPAAQATLVARHWAAAVRANAAAGVAWLAPAVLEREQRRAAELMERVLKLERERAPFSVLRCEHEVSWREAAASLTLRIDRIDQTAAGEQLVIDYKSGELDSIRLQDGEARPLQLAAYVVALAQAGMNMDGAALLGLKPAQPGFAGAAIADDLLPRVKAAADWPAAQQQWRQQLQALFAAHLDGSAPLTATPAVCRYCHLPAFCRRRARGEVLLDEDSGDE